MSTLWLQLPLLQLPLFSPNLVKLKEKEKTNVLKSVLLCLKNDSTRPNFSSKTVSQSCLLFWAWCLLSLLLVSRLCVSVMLLSAHFRHSFVPWECSLLQCIYRLSLSMFLSIGATYSVCIFLLSEHTSCVCVCMNPFFTHSETEISQSDVIWTR